MRLSDLEDLVNGQQTSTAIPYFRTTKCMHKWYNAQITHGMSLTQVSEYIVKEAKFSLDAHCILGWGTSVFVYVFYRALQGCTLVIEKINTDRTSFLPED
jgi:hypothetical protein